MRSDTTVSEMLDRNSECVAYHDGLNHCAERTPCYMSNSEKCEEPVLLQTGPEGPGEQLAFDGGCLDIHRAYTRSASSEFHCWDGEPREEACWSSDGEGKGWKDKTGQSDRLLGRLPVRRSFLRASDYPAERLERVGVEIVGLQLWQQRLFYSVWS
jgi:hypothetical protein